MKKRGKETKAGKRKKDERIGEGKREENKGEKTKQQGWHKIAQTGHYLTS